MSSLTSSVSHPSLNIQLISKNFSGVLLDAYGVFWGGNEVGLLPGAKDAMEKLMLNGKIVGILSNTTALVSKEIIKLEQHGIIQGKHFHFITTSGEVMRNTFLNKDLPFETPNHKFFLFGTIHPKLPSHEPIFQGTSYTQTSDVEEADFIYISIPHINGEDQVDREVFRGELEKLKASNLPMICPNPDQFAYEGKQAKAFVKQGSIAKMYEEMGGIVHCIGKPYAKVYHVAMDNFSHYDITDPKEILMVGDTPETDIRGACKFGMSSALLIQGIMGGRVELHGLEEAMSVLPDEDRPHYLAKRL